jgi:hypothetical protein
LTVTGETAMGFVIVSVILRDGRRFDRLCVAWDTIVGIPDVTEPPFEDDEIADLIVIHDRTGRLHGMKLACEFAPVIEILAQPQGRFHPADDQMTWWRAGRKVP